MKIKIFPFKSEKTRSLCHRAVAAYKNSREDHSSRIVSEPSELDSSS